MQGVAKPASCGNVIRILGVLSVAVLMGCPPSTLAPKFSIIMLDTRETSGEGLNDRGEAVGQVVISPGQRRGFVWRTDHSPKVTVIDTFGGDYGYAGGINESSVVAGYANTGEFWTHALRWMDSGGSEDLGALGVGYSAALDVNNGGEIVGHTGYTDGTRRAMIWKPASGMQVISGAPADSFAKAINNLSAVVGATHSEDHFGTADPPVGQVWYDDGTVDSIPSALGGDAAIAAGINDTGTVVGLAEDASAAFRAFRWTRSGGMVDLGSLGFSIFDDYLFCSSASGINDAEDIVGSAAATEERLHAVLWKGNTLYDLNDCIPAGTDWEYLANATAINASGCIVGTGYISEGTALAPRAFLLVPVRLKTLTLSDFRVLGGKPVTVTAFLDAAAPLALDLSLRLEGLSGAARLKADVVRVPAGGDHISFTILTESVESACSGEVVVSFGGITLTKSLVVSPH